MSTSALKRLSWEEYVDHERHATEKSEFFDGELFAMAGGTFKVTFEASVTED